MTLACPLVVARQQTTPAIDKTPQGLVDPATEALLTNPVGLGLGGISGYGFSSTAEVKVNR